MREQQARMLDEQGELQATVSQMRDELKAKDAELTKLKPDHRPSFWAEPKLVRNYLVAACLSSPVAALNSNQRAVPLVVGE